MIEWAILFGAAVSAGVLNAIAGGGSFLTFPALVFTGIPPVAANATSAVAVFPGYLGAVAGFHQEVRNFDRKLLTRYLLVSLMGGFIGSLLLLITTDEVFSFIIPWLLLFATLIFGCGEYLLKLLKLRSEECNSSSYIFLLLGVSIYGGYFNGGLGIVLLAALLFTGLTDLNLMNGLKNGISFCISIVSVVTFSVAGLVYWQEAIVMMVAATFGGFVGARLAKVIPQRLLKYLITGVGLIMAIVFFYRF